MKVREYSARRCVRVLRDSTSQSVYHQRSASTISTSPSPSTSTSTALPHESTPLKPVTTLSVGTILLRPPQVTRNLHPFEKSFYLYQRRLNERLSLPFTRYFYFKPDSPALSLFSSRVAARKTVARDIGTYDAYGKEGWNDEVLVGDNLREPDNQVEALVAEAEVPGPGGEEGEKVERPASRITDADRKGDQKSLNRALERSLVLLVKNSEGRWMLPSARIVKGETLDQAAERILIQSAGPNMNTWVIGHNPIGHYDFRFRKPLPVPDVKVQEVGDKTFFMRARIMAGQADLKASVLGFTDFKWLYREEVEMTVSPQYWAGVKGMLPER